jgi:hypothetical protein
MMLGTNIQAASQAARGVSNKGLDGTSFHFGILAMVAAHNR